MIGRTLGPYQIVEELGRGGMAIVYKAFQPSLGRYVALKVLPEYSQHDPEFIARFQREARAAGGGLRQLTSGSWVLTPTWSPDSQWIAFTLVRDSNGNGIRDEDDQSGIWAVAVGGGDAVPLVQGPYQNGDPAWTW